MKYRSRTFYTDPQNSKKWDRWQRGEFLSSIGSGLIVHRLRSMPCKLAENTYLCRAKSAKLTRKWSPHQIAVWLMREHPY